MNNYCNLHFFPGLELNDMFMQKVLGGYRMGQPMFATDDL